MELTVLDIVARRKGHFADLASLGDFVTRPAGTTGVETVVRNDAVTLYCLDAARRLAVFVETPRAVDVTAAPFYYQTQYAHAVRLLIGPYDVLHRARAAERLREHLVVIFSIGRCGSTLLSRIFGAVPSVDCVNEPDVYTGLAASRVTAHADPETLDLLRSATAFICRGTRRSTVVMKPRSTAFDLADLFHVAYPTAKLMFLYRDLDDWACSMASAFGTTPCPEFVARTLVRQPSVVAYLTRRRGAPAEAATIDELVRRLQDIPSSKALTLMWLGLMERHRALREDGVPLTSLSYDTLVTTPVRSVRRIFDCCGIVPDAVRTACRAFEEDAQRDTPLARTAVASRAAPSARARVLRAARAVLSSEPFAGAAWRLRHADLIARTGVAAP
jgi:hypothetical protein